MTSSFHMVLPRLKRVAFSSVTARSLLPNVSRVILFPVLMLVSLSTLRTTMGLSRLAHSLGASRMYNTLLLRSNISPSSVSCFAFSTASRSCRFMCGSQLTSVPTYTGPHLLFTCTVLPIRPARNAAGTFASINLLNTKTLE
uniref:Uncharacterized protein n=1 Tax=Trypanosoma congolense (strain IL3000) TaxID=1068625 RepID=F9WHM0_TRYCI|nr:hypothetical protein, unlikely [Trypanosoma congolense IL3000]